MRLSALLSSLFLAALFAVAPSHAYTPESGIWSNPNESGSGYVIEIQDNLMVLAYYGGDAQGRAVWHLASGLLNGNALFDNKQMNRTVGSQCIGCPYLGAPTTLVGDGGTVTVRFDPNDNTKATLTWGNGRVVPIRRQWFYFKQGIDPQTMPVEATMMLGEWQMVMDFSSNSQSSFDYYGDVLVFKTHHQTANVWYFDGCRADNSVAADCSQSALLNHDASGSFNSVTGLHTIVVEDSPSNFVRYIADIGTNSGEGEITVYPRNTNPDNYASYPFRMFRTASRNYVLHRSGPAKADTGGAAVASSGLADRLAAAGMALAPRGNVPSKYDHTDQLAITRALEAQLDADDALR
jgi:hypothetical protein